MSQLEHFAVWTLGVLIAGGVAWSIHVSDRPMGDAARDARTFTARGVLGHGDPLRANIDPLLPPGLPGGVRIDPETGYMVGIALPPDPDYRDLDWTALDDENLATSVPAEIQALHNEPVRMTGFLQALYDVSDLRTFLLVGNHFSCCFGRFPGLGGLVEVTLGVDQPDADMTFAPIVVRGRLRIEPLRVNPRDAKSRVVLLFHLDDARVSTLDGD